MVPHEHDAPYSITANFALTHTNASTPLYAPGVFPGGILTPDYTASPARYSSTRSQLMIFGDVNAVGNALVLVRYSCPATSLVRSSAPSGTLRPAPGPLLRQDRRTCSTT